LGMVKRYEERKMVYRIPYTTGFKTVGVRDSTIVSLNEQTNRTSVACMLRREQTRTGRNESKRENAHTRSCMRGMQCEGG
jgi:hypothetical protein